MLAPVPATDPGFIVQLPPGRPLTTTLPVDIAQVGCVMVPIIGVNGVPGAALITTLAEGTDVHPAALVTVKLYVPAVSPEMIVLAPLPANAPGFIVQLPAGRPLSVTLPVATVHVGCIMDPVTGAVGVAGWAFTVTDVGSEIQVISPARLAIIL